MNGKIKAALLAGVLAVGSVATASADEIKLGASAPLTGPRALLGKYFKEGVDMAVEEINANGGVLGKKLSIAYEDDQADNPNAAITSMSKLMEVAKVPIVLGPHFSVAQLATMKNYCNGSLISITGASGVPVTDQGCNYVIRIRGNDNLQAKAVVAYALDHLKVSKIGIISINDDFGKGGAERVVAALKEKGLSPVANETHNAGDADFSAQLSSLQKAGAELVVMWTHDNESALIVRQTRQFGLPFKFAGSTSLSQPVFIELAGPTAEGVVSATDFLPANPDPNVKAFVEKFHKKYGEMPELYAATYYDGAILAAKAINDAGTTDAVKVREAFAKMDTQGVLGHYKCEANGDCNHQTNIVEIKNGQPSLLTVVKF
ncbi:ABC transporter substrate-binding protein [Chelatococcus asaccharovorans]|uniref:Amino acid/amide ABC transporter substrate-binding protein (HAAT family) n=1 Tax=Chelatococcus asaccharovorans TaxID=28210 RepID=A0A2V3TXA7_9HYPH|nr:ABC transporter substrate-binding protein [Chelatococcus asaccharovorans]MBS7705121.1 ABC transporter substrate-binding protein [Chelatococcus asaccharovorans]PXW53615.1 amino acid/amide ABC transporter substrate-binding protein (HAAT family) [Chelatococcus asaccharovorans]